MSERKYNIGTTFFNFVWDWVCIYYLWNWIMPEMFGLPTITVWKALGLGVLCSALFVARPYEKVYGRF
jgi:hypothetical protein